MSFQSASSQYKEAVQMYFSNKEREGYDMKPFMWMLRNPGGIPAKNLIALAHHLGCDLGELLSNGLGRNLTYDCLDRAIKESQPGYRLGTVEHLD